MKLGTSCFTTLGAQREELASYLNSLCRAASVDTNLAERVIDAFDTLDPLHFDTIQRSTLERFPEPSRNNSYLDVCRHIAKSMKTYLVVMPRDTRPRKMLDIGSGSGSFCFVCNALGHDSTGLDRPRSGDNDDGDFLSLNYLLTQWHNVQVLEHAISPRVPLPVEDHSYDDFSILHPTFYRRWKEPDWNFLLSDLSRCATKKKSKLYIKINTRKLKDIGGEFYAYGEFFRSIDKLNFTTIQDKHYVVDLA
jgi:predicted RNA methylase